MIRRYPLFLSLCLTGYIEPSRIASTFICCWKFVWVESCGLFWGTGKDGKCSEHVKCTIRSKAGIVPTLCQTRARLGSASRPPRARLAPYWESYKSTCPVSYRFCVQSRVMSFSYYFLAQGIFRWFYRSFPCCLCSGSIWIPSFQRNRLSRLKGNLVILSEDMTSIL